MSIDLAAGDTGARLPPARSSAISWPFRIAAIAAAALAASCGGGDSAGDAQRASATSAAPPRQKATAFVPSTPIPSDASTRGMWSPVYNWPIISVHTVLLPDGRVLSYGSDLTGLQTAHANVDIWDATGAPDAGHLTLPNATGTDIFCSSQLLMPQSGSVFIAGGDNWTGTQTTNGPNNNSNLFTPSSNTLARGGNMNRPRWYSSSTTLISGETYVQGGSGGSDHPEIRGTDGTFRLMSAIDTNSIGSLYPRNFVAPDGRIFGYDPGNGNMYWIDPTGSGSMKSAGAFNAGYSGGTSSSTAMYRPGRILQIGGNSNGAYTIDITSGTPVVTATQSMSSTRAWVNATILADGKVVATSGSAVPGEATGANNIAEMWDPATGQWTQGYSAAKMRLYHSNALLLPDASVLVSGGGATAPTLDPNPNKKNLNAEIYYPPYLFNAAGARATRPTILNAPDSLDIGKTFGIDVPDAASVSRITLVKTGSTTHSFNLDQRFIELTFRASGSHVSVQAPTHAGDATPGYYMLFAFNEAGVPSVAKILRMGIASNPNPAINPAITNPGAQTSTLGDTVTLALAASDPNGDTLSYAAAGLPPGLAVNATTGVISGTPTTSGSYNVVVSATDGVNTASASFSWTTQASSPLTLDTPPAPAFLAVSGTATYTASASGGSNMRYRWNFGDGSGDSAWSSSATTTHAYTAPGNYTVTVSVTDDSGAVRSRSFSQIVYLPPTATAPASSSNLLVETPASGNPRLWVVNQDNDSVSVFDTVTAAKLAEIAVGSAPRTIALASNGMLWVANKRDSSLSVINTGTRAVSRTIALPRGSQPFGIAIAPASTTAYIALEASGTLLKFDTASYAQTGSLAVGANPRQVSVSGDGTTVYVSRFITPPLPGEATATITPTAATGGEVVQIAAAPFAVTRTIVLQHSDKPDTENQGRGIPNYLGAVAISPDGSQAWVPSKQDNVKRGALRDGTGLNFQSTVRAISSRIVLATGQEDLAKRVDHDNSSVASAAVYDPKGAYLFVALETSREIAVVDAYAGIERLRIAAGRAPQGLAVSADGTRLYVSNFMDRNVGVYDLTPLLQQGVLSVPAVGTWASVAVEKLTTAVLTGKQFFYDALDTRLARDRYMSCATCHNDGGQDGRVWDMTGQGEGLRNTIALRGRGGMAQGLLHWSANFDEVQDFEGQIRVLAGGTGLMSDTAFNTGTRNQPLGDKKAGVSADLDALAAYVSSLTAFDASPNRPSAAALSSAATAGRAVFQAQNCAACHGGSAFTNSGTTAPMNIGSLKASSGSRLGGPLTGIDVPTLRDVWATAPYLHDGSAATLDAAVAAHKGVALAAADMSSLTAYLREIGADEPAALTTTATGAGAGLTGSYFNNMTLGGSAALQRNEAVDFDWGGGSPGTGVNADGFSVRWTGKVLALTSGPHLFRTISDDGVRLWIDNVLVIDNWNDHAPTTNTSLAVMLSAGKQYDVRMEYYENGGGATARLQWQQPGDTAFNAVPKAQLYPGTVISTAGTGLTGSYFNNITMSGTAALSRVEAVDFDWGSGSPGTGVNADNFSARWSGTLTAPASGTYYFQTSSDDGVRVTVNGTRVISNWTDHSATTNTSGGISLTAGQRYTVLVEYYEKGGSAVMRLRWRTPTAGSYVAIPKSALNPS